MSIEDILLALRAAEEGAIDRDSLTRVLSIIDTWDRGGLHPSAGELLTKQFRVDPTKVRRWESEITGTAQRRIGRYQLRRKVGQGGMGIVFEARDPNLGRTVALKLLASDRLESPDSVQRFLREAKSAGSFNHPNIVHAFDAGIDGDLPYLVMEFVDGENLYQVLKRRGAIPPAEVLGWVIQAGRALDVLERQRWVHGDVKPSNFILTRDGVVKLADLGLCGPPGKPRPGVSPHGTPPYIAPEVLAGETIDHRADLYSLGATAYHLLAGRPPRVSRSIDALREEMASPVVPIAEACPGVSAGFAKIIMTLLETQPSHRHSGGQRLLGDLEALVPVETPATDEETLVDAPDHPAAPAPRRSGIAWGIGLAVVAVGIAIGILAGPGGGSSPADGDGGPDVVADGGGAGTANGGEEGSATGTVAANLAEAWLAVLEEQEGDFPALYRWLASEGAASPEVETWRAALTGELSRLAAPAWAELEARLIGLRFDGRYHEALAALEAFPVAWRAGPYGVAWEEARAGVREERRTRLARLLLALESAEDTFAAVRVLHGIGAMAPADAAWFRSHLFEHPRGAQALRAIEDDVTATRASRNDRSQEVARALRSGELPSPRFDAVDPADLPRELALAWLARYPSLRGLEGTLLERLHTIDALADVPPDVLSTLLALLGETADVLAEIAAATIARDLREALRAFDAVAADRAWLRLGAPDRSATVAARAVAATEPEDRRELVRAAFLRSDAFIAEVRGAWRAPVTFRWETDDPRFDEEWRLVGRFTESDGGLRARGRGDWQVLGLAIPFEPRFTLEFTFVPPEGEWTLALAHGRNALGLGARGTGPDATAVAGDQDAVADILRGGSGVACTLVPVADPPGGVRIHLEVDGGDWSLDGAPPFSVLDDPLPRWLRFAIPDGGWIGPVEITGTIVEPWLEARQEHLQGE